MDDWEHDQKILEGLRVEALHLPCLSMTGLAVKFPKHKPQIFVFTSANAVRYAARHPALVNLMRGSECVYAIGIGTLSALREFKVQGEVPEGVKNAEELAVYMSRNIRPDTYVAWPSSREPSYDLQGHLARYGIYVTPLPVYATEKQLHLPNGKLPDQPTIERYIQSLEGVVCFASPSAIDGFARTLAPSENRLRRELTAVVIGTTTKAACEGHFDRIITIAEPRVELLAETARATLAERG